MDNNTFKNAIQNLTNIFFQEFEYCYKNINSKSKRKLLQSFYLSYRKWYYTTLLLNTELSPAFIMNNIDNSYIPVVKCSKSRLANLKLYVYKNSIDNPVILHDLIVVYENSDNGIYSTGKYIFNNEFYNRVYKYLYIDDMEYLNYILNISLKIGLLKYSPALYVTALIKCKTDFFEKTPRQCFEIIVNSAIELASEKINEYLIFGDINTDIIKNWLKHEHNVDKIFERDFDYFYNDDLNIDNEKFFDAVLYSRYESGVAFDKWFLTPFGAYLGLIIPSYTTEMNMYGDMDLFLEIEDGNKKYNCDRDSAMVFYSPCTNYYLTDLGREYFENNNTYIPDNIFKTYTTEQLVYMLTNDKFAEYYDDIVKNFYPPYNMFYLRITWTLNKDVWFDIEVSESIVLKDLADYIFDCLFNGKSDLIKYKFYTLPENPFMTFEYPVNSTRSDNVYNKPIFSLYDKSEILIFSFAAEFLDNYMEFDFEISLVNVNENSDYSKINLLVNSSYEFENIFK